MPDPSETMLELWERLPQVIQDKDVDTSLFRWVQGGRIEIDTMDALLEALQLSDDVVSKLVDPATMDDAWISWNRMIRGIPQTGLPPEVARQNLTAGAFTRGTIASIIQVVKYYLTGTQSVRVYQRSNDVDPFGTAGPWDVCIVVRTDEFSAPVTPVEAVIAAKCKPAGVNLTYRAVGGTTWEDIEAAFPTWADWHDAATWANIT